MDPIRSYRHFVNWLRAETGSSPELLHVNCGLALWMAMVLVLRKPLWSPWPVAIVLVAACGNEVMDALFWRRVQGSAGIDIFNSVAWPAAIAVLARLADRRR